MVEGGRNPLIFGGGCDLNKESVVGAGGYTQTRQFLYLGCLGRNFQRPPGSYGIQSRIWMKHWGLRVEWALLVPSHSSSTFISCCEPLGLGNAKPTPLRVRVWPGEQKTLILCISFAVSAPKLFIILHIPLELWGGGSDSNLILF